MGCGHSKINIYPRRSKNRNSPKKSVTPDKTEAPEEEMVDNETESEEKLEDCDSRRPIKVKPFSGPLLAQVEISTSQQNFFKMLDEKIENGPDYDSASESERAAEEARLRYLLRDWETASAGSRSLPATPSRRRADRDKGMRSNELSNRHNPNISNLVQQSYGLYRQTGYSQGYPTPPGYQPYPNQPSMFQHQMYQYQTVNQAYVPPQQYQPPPKHYPSYNQHGSPIKMVYPTATNPVKHIPYEQPQVTYSPSHRLYTKSSAYSNGEVPPPQHAYGPHQPQNQRDHQQYGPHQGVRDQMNVPVQTPTSTRSYQSSVHIPIVMNANPADSSPMHRKQYQMT